MLFIRCFLIITIIWIGSFYLPKDNSINPSETMLTTQHFRTLQINNTEIKKVITTNMSPMPNDTTTNKSNLYDSNFKQAPTQTCKKNLRYEL